jgi:EAL domain-containing protein (putative c-di-GMP-specific phosphodiesterase class I)
MKSEKIQQYYLRCLTSDLTGWKNPLQKLAKAFAQNDFVLFSQSILRLQAGDDDRRHLEIFVRLKEEERNLVPPGTFLPILEHYNQGPKLDRYVLRRALVWHRGNHRDHGSVLHMNLCRGTLADLEFPLFVADELAAAGVGGDSLCFEIPDVNKPCEPGTREFARKLRAVGCTVAVANLDPEHISFQPANDLSAGFMKIGGSITRGVAINRTAAARIRAIARACRAFGVHTVAQHVEDRDTLNELRNLGLDYAQGYGISEPQPIGSSVHGC